MEKAYSSAGLLVKWAVESSAGTMPTSGFTTIPGVKAIPAFGDDVNTLDSTVLSNKVSKTYIRGLRDSGGAIALTVNDSKQFRNAVASMITAYESAVSANKALWIEYAYPEAAGMDSFYFPAEPVDPGFGGGEVDSILENSLVFLPQGDYLFATAST